MPTYLKSKASLTEILSLIVGVLAWVVGPVRFSTDWSLLNRIGLPHTLSDCIGIAAFGWVAWMVISFGARLRAKTPKIRDLDQRFCGWLSLSLLIAITMLSTRTIDRIRYDAQRTLSEQVRTIAQQTDFNNNIAVLQLFNTFEQELLRASDTHRVVNALYFDIQVLGSNNDLRALPGFHFGFNDEQTIRLLDRRFPIYQDRSRWATAVGAFVSGETLWIQNGFLPAPYLGHPFIKFDNDVIVTGSLIACPSNIEDGCRFVLDVSTPHANSFNDVQRDLIEQFVDKLAGNPTLLKVIENRPW